MRKFLEIGGYIAAVVLIAFGVGAVYTGLNARGVVQDTLAQENIVGTPDMTPTAIKAEAKQAGLDVSKLTFPTLSVAGKDINSGDRAHAFAGYMRIHALEATGGLTYAQMPRYATADGKGTNDPAQAVQVNGQPQDNGARQVWVTETALATALQSSYMADQLSLFGSRDRHRSAPERHRLRHPGSLRRAEEPGGRSRALLRARAGTGFPHAGGRQLARPAGSPTSQPPS